MKSNGVELKAERRKPSGEQHCDIEDIPSLTGVLAHFRLHDSTPFGMKPSEPQATSDYLYLVEPLLASENSSGALSSATRTNKITS